MKYLYDLARCSKCQSFIALQSTNKLYGAPDDSCCIHEIDVPFLMNTDLTFRADVETKRVIGLYDEFFIPNDYPHIILPLYYWDMYKGGDIIAIYNKTQDLFTLVDKTTMNPIDQIQMFQKREFMDFGRQELMNQIEGLFSRFKSLGPINTFTSMENQPSIRRAYDSKISAGRILCRLTNDNIDVLFYFYKGLFSLAKSDVLDIDVQFDSYETGTFMLTFKPKKKRNPLMFNTYGVPFSEKIYCMFRSLM